jgi:hypothetical protein
MLETPWKKNQLLRNTFKHMLTISVGFTKVKIFAIVEYFPLWEYFVLDGFSFE